MLLRPTSQRRTGAVVLESAIIYPVTFLLIIGLVVGGLGIFRYQECASLAREGARYASTHGANYRKDAGQPVSTGAAWKQDVYDNAIAPRMVGLDPSLVGYDVTWPDVINQPGKPDNWPGSKVTVTVSYRWFPEVYLVGPITLSSTSSMPISN